MRKNYFEKLTKVILVQVMDVLPDCLGGQEIIWRDYLQTWANVEQINHLSPQIRSNNFSKNFYKFTIRAQNKLNIKMRIIMQDRIFNIETVNACKDNKAYCDVIAYERIKHDIRT